MVSRTSTRTRTRTRTRGRAAGFNPQRLVAETRLEGSDVRRRVHPLRTKVRGPVHGEGRAEISNILSIGTRARSIISGLNSTRGLRRTIQSWSFSSVFIFINRHSLHRQ